MHCLLNLRDSIPTNHGPERCCERANGSSMLRAGNPKGSSTAATGLRPPDYSEYCSWYSKASKETRHGCMDPGRCNGHA